MTVAYIDVSAFTPGDVQIVVTTMIHAEDKINVVTGVPSPESIRHPLTVVQINLSVRERGSYHDQLEDARKAARIIRQEIEDLTHHSYVRACRLWLAKRQGTVAT
tara:strand:- start:7493 stop:7807 length:315 start_codon:yes stop_codon:yes gene_type:complete